MACLPSSVPLTTASNSSTHTGGIWLTALITRLPSLTHAEFSTYWKESHAPLVAPWLASQGVLNYRQIHINPATAAILGLLEENALQYDGMVQIQVKSLEAWAEVVKDPFYRDVIVPDEQRFFAGKVIVLGLVGEVFVGVEQGVSLV